MKSNLYNKKIYQKNFKVWNLYMIYYIKNVKQ